MPIEKMLYASESAAEEAELELQSLLEEFKEWKQNNKGSFNDFLKDATESLKLLASADERIETIDKYFPEDNPSKMLND